MMIEKKALIVTIGHCMTNTSIYKHEYLPYPIDYPVQQGDVYIDYKDA